MAAFIEQQEDYERGYLEKLKLRDSVFKEEAQLETLDANEVDST